MSLPMLTNLFGKAGLSYYQFVRGIDNRPVNAHRNRKSVGCEHTFRHDIKLEALDPVLDEVIADLVERVNEKHFDGKRLTLKVRFPDFTTVTRSLGQSQLLNEANVIKPLAQQLLASVDIPKQGIRLLGLTVSKTEIEERLLALTEQIPLFKSNEIDTP